MPDHPQGLMDLVAGLLGGGLLCLCILGMTEIIERVRQCRRRASFLRLLHPPPCSGNRRR